MNFKTAEDAFSYIDSFINLERNHIIASQKYNLDNIKKLCKIFGNPQKSFHSIHVAGSKGKGSTASFVASALSANGIKTGLYTSPHLTSYKERISLAGSFFSDSIYIEAITELLDTIKHEDYTTFELLTILSFLIFRKTNCSWGVFETGLGGRLDATNVIIPEASILTLIELEHTNILGSTIREIATEKAGIIKRGIPVFSASQDKEASSVFKQRAKELSCPIFFLENAVKSIETVKPSDNFLQAANISLSSGKNYKMQLKMPGKFQLSNAALALSYLDYLLETTSLLPAGFIASKGIGLTMLPGRCEIIERDKTGAKINPVFLDCAHTVNSVRAAATTFFETLCKKDEKPLLIFGAVEGKDVLNMAKILLPMFSNIIISKPGTFKKNNPKEVFNIFRTNSQKFHDLQLIEQADKALKKAMDYNAPIFVTGSFYMVSEIKKLLV